MCVRESQSKGIVSMPSTFINLLLNVNTFITGVGSGGGGGGGGQGGHVPPHFFDWGGNGMFVPPHF